MARLLAQVVRVVGREAALGRAEEEEVGEAPHHQAVQAADPVGPGLAERLPAPAVDVVAVAAAEAGADLEAGGEDQAVDLMSDTVDDHGVLGDPLDALAVGVHQLDRRPVEGLQVFVVEAGPLAELAVPGLQGLGRGRVLDHRLGPGADALHGGEVGDLHQLGQLLGRQARRALLAGDEDQLAEGLGPAVIDQVLLGVAAADQEVEIVHPVVLPAGRQGTHPVGVYGLVVTHIHSRGRALEDVELARALGQVGHALHGGGAGADDADPLVADPVQAAQHGAAGVLIVPAAGVEGVALEGLDAGDARQLGLVQGAVGHDHEAGAHGVAVVGRDDPALGRLVPGQVLDRGLEAGVLVEVIVPGDAARMLEDLGRLGVAHLGDEAGLLQQGQVDQALDVAGRAGIAVPVPGAAEVAGRLDHAQGLHPGLAQAGAGQEAAEAAADHHHLDLVGQGRAFDGRLDVGVVAEVGEPAGDLQVLIVAVRADALVALGAVAVPEGVRVEGHVVPRENLSAAGRVAHVLSPCRGN